MDAADHGNQTANVNGDGNTVIIVHGDMYGACPPTNNSTPAPVPGRKPRRRRRWLGTYAGVLTVVSTAVLGILMIPPPDSEQPTTSTASAQVTATLRLSPPTPTVATPRLSSTALLNAARILSSEREQRGQWPHGTSALCKDNTFSSSQSRSGTCSWHGGVALWRYPADDTHWQDG